MTSSPVTAAHVEPDMPHAVNILELLSQVPDPRCRRGRRHRLEVILALGVAAVTAGAESLVGIWDWAQDLGPALLRRLQMPAVIPSETTIRRVLEACDPVMFNLLLGAWMRHRPDSMTGPRVVAVDGKTLRRSADADGRLPHLISILGHDTGLVLAQSRVDSKTNEIPAIRDLLGTMDLTEMIVTADALHTQTATASFITDHGADFVFTVKKNQPTLHKQITALPWTQIPVGCTTTDVGHGRRVTRTVKAIETPAWIGFPGARQVLQVRRTTTRQGKRTVEVAYLICSKTMCQAQPAVVAGWVQHHWGIENRLHWVRDVTFDEDRCRVRTGHGAELMATLRNLAISLLRLAGWDNIAAGLRHTSRDPNRAANLLLTT